MVSRIAMAMLVASALLIGLAAQAQDTSSGVLLTAEDLKKLVEPSLLIAGRSVWAGTFFANLFVRGGILYNMYTDDLGNGGPEKATWRLDGDKFCNTLHAYGGERCRHWYRLADGSYEARLVPGEKLDATFRIVNKP
ncbi:MAG: hypothetical protein ACHQZQ_05800 [SAR324 cluster bacterium]